VDGEVQTPARHHDELRRRRADVDGPATSFTTAITWAMSGNDTTIRCRELIKDVALRSGRARSAREKGSLGGREGDPSPIYRGRGEGERRAPERENGGRVLQSTINGAGNGRVSWEGETTAVNGSGPVAARCRGVSVSGQQGRAGPSRVRGVGLGRSGSRAWSPGRRGRARRCRGSVCSHAGGSRGEAAGVPSVAGRTASAVGLGARRSAWRQHAVSGSGSRAVAASGMQGAVGRLARTRGLLASGRWTRCLGTVGVERSRRESREERRGREEWRRRLLGAGSGVAGSIKVAARSWGQGRLLVGPSGPNSARARVLYFFLFLFEFLFMVTIYIYIHCRKKNSQNNINTNKYLFCRRILF
jgi:hypothetical protein